MSVATYPNENRGGRDITGAEHGYEIHMG